MKNTITIGNFELTLGTAIAISAGDDARKPAIHIHQISDEFSNGDSVVFGVDRIDEFDEDDIIDLLRDESSGDPEDVASFREDCDEIEE